MADASSADIDNVVLWLIKIAENTAKIRDAAEKGYGGSKGDGSEARRERSQASQFDTFTRKVEQALTHGVAQTIARAQSLAQRGLSGTAEGARQDYHTELLSQQLAGVMLPFTQAMTYLTAGLTMRLATFNGTEQNRLAGGLAGAALGMRYGGLGGALAGGVVGSSIMGSTGTAFDSISGGAAGMYMGARFGPVGAAAGYAVGSVALSGDYGRLRGEGTSRFGSAVGSTIGALTDAGWGASRLLGATGVNPMDAIRREADARARGPAPPPARRDVTPFAAEMGDAGSFYFKAQIGTTRATAGGGDDGGPLQPFMDVLLRIFDALRTISSGGGAVAPMPAPAAG